ncbi:hypothetical protein [Kitasatospora sp. NPDC059599]|uniref:effector-associated constant component EACC1 n=1 Tax=Kitasatospora sp. NPDC059599 TaxID=3346880 RepID=UPI0036B9A715
MPSRRPWSVERKSPEPVTSGARVCHYCADSPRHLRTDMGSILAEILRFLAPAGALAAVTAAGSAWLRGVVRALFRNPHETTVVVRGPDGVELSAASVSPEEVTSLLRRLDQVAPEETHGDARKPEATERDSHE